MWSERFVLIVTSEHQDWLPSSWAMYRPSVIDGAILFGTISFFLLLFLIMIRFVPFLPIAEQKELLAELRHDAERATDSKKEVTRAAGAVG
jgi:molybdopterin-containing oxidoreductase family membrane subunit